MTGNPGKRPLNDREPEPDRAIPDPPDHLNKLALEEWHRVTQELFDIGVLSIVDRSALAAYCVAWGRWVEAERYLATTELVLTGENNGGYYQNPMLAVANKALEQIHKFAAEFGMTPSSRTRIKVSPVESKRVGSVMDFLDKSNP